MYVLILMMVVAGLRPGAAVPRGGVPGPAAGLHGAGDTAGPAQAHQDKRGVGHYEHTLGLQ